MYYLRTIEQVPEAAHVTRFTTKRGALWSVGLHRAASAAVIELYERDPESNPLAFDVLPAMSEAVRSKLLGRQIKSIMSRRPRAEQP